MMLSAVFIAIRFTLPLRLFCHYYALLADTPLFSCHTLLYVLLLRRLIFATLRLLTYATLMITIRCR